MAHVRKLKRKTTKNGKPVYVFQTRYVDLDRRERAQNFSTRREADDFAAKVHLQVREGSFVDPQRGRVLFGAFAEEWLATKGHLKAKTLEGYRSLLREHLLPQFGKKRLNTIRAMEVDRLLARMSERGLSASRVRQVRQVLLSIFKSAVADQRLARSPMQGSEFKIKGTSRQMQPLEAAEVSRMVAEMPNRYKALIYVLATGGLRWGEATALRRKDCNMLQRRLEISRSASEVGGALVFSDTKTHTSRRSYLPAFVCEQLASHLGRYADPDPNGLVFTSEEGGPLRGSNFRSRIWRPALERAGLPASVRLHDLRHTTASLLLSNGASIKAAQAQLGHSTATLTLDTYASLMKDEQRAASAVLDEVFKQQETQ